MLHLLGSDEENKIIILRNLSCYKTTSSMHCQRHKGGTLNTNLLNTVPKYLIMVSICKQQEKYNYQTSAAFVKAFIAAM